MSLFNSKKTLIKVRTMYKLKVKHQRRETASSGGRLRLFCLYNIYQSLILNSFSINYYFKNITSSSLFYIPCTCHILFYDLFSSQKKKLSSSISGLLYSIPK